MGIDISNLDQHWRVNVDILVVKPKSDYCFSIGLIVGIILTILVVKLRKLPHRIDKPKIKSKNYVNSFSIITPYYTEKRLQVQELISDLLLVMSVSFFTAYLWSPLIDLVIRTSNINTRSGSFDFIFTISLYYMIFYLPFRIVYLIEEGGYSKKHFISFLFLLLVILIRSLFYFSFNKW